MEKRTVDQWAVLNRKKEKKNELANKPTPFLSERRK
jgi:hypothetical protein